MALLGRDASSLCWNSNDNFSISVIGFVPPPLVFRPDSPGTARIEMFRGLA